MRLIPYNFEDNKVLVKVTTIYKIVSLHSLPSQFYDKGCFHNLRIKKSAAVKRISHHFFRAISNIPQRPITSEWQLQLSSYIPENLLFYLYVCPISYFYLSVLFFLSMSLLYWVKSEILIFNIALHEFSG